jgi:ferritin-like metal-binding protein YciE
MLGGTKIHEPTELFTHKLGAALTMENTVLEMLGKLQEKAQSGELQQLLSHHAQETEQQIQNVQRAFEALGEEVDDSPCPAIEGLEKEGEANLKMTDDSLNDDVILGGAAETEHHEIAVYETLITHAEAMGHEDVVALLRENLEQEEHTLREVQQLARQKATQMAARA